MTTALTVYDECIEIVKLYDRQPFPGFEAGVNLVKKDIAYRIKKARDAALLDTPPVPAVSEGWRTIADEPVPDRTDVLLLAFLDGVPKYGIGGTFTWVRGQVIQYDWCWGVPPAHWMPLPAAPIAPEKEDKR